MAPTDPLALKRAALITEAQRWVGTAETRPNHGPQIEAFEKALGYPAVGQSWCMVFVQYCVMKVDAATGTPSTWLAKSESCMDVWTRSPLHSRVQGLDVQPGDLMVWQHWVDGKPAYSGHVGIVTKVLGPGKFETIEGNTSPSTHEIDRDGDGVYVKVRDVGGSSIMKVKGFLRVWNPGG